MKTSLRHVGIVVKDVSLWISFLTRNFGFESYLDQIEQGNFISELLGLPNVQVRTIKFSDGGTGVIEILHFIEPVNKSNREKPFEPDSYGITHIAIQVDSIQSTLISLSQDGYIPINSPLISDDGNAIVCYLRGPEGVLIEIVELVK